MPISDLHHSPIDLDAERIAVVIVARAPPVPAPVVDDALVLRISDRNRTLPALDFAVDENCGAVVLA